MAGLPANCYTLLYFFFTLRSRVTAASARIVAAAQPNTRALSPMIHGDDDNNDNDDDDDKCYNLCVFVGLVDMQIVTCRPCQRRLTTHATLGYSSFQHTARIHCGNARHGVVDVLHAGLLAVCDITGVRTTRAVALARPHSTQLTASVDHLGRQT